MALLKYLRPVDELLIYTGSPSCSMSSTAIAESNRKLQVKGKKRGQYLKVSREDKAIIGKYASENGVSRAVRYFKEKYLKESSIRDWKKAYEKEVNEKCKFAKPGETVIVKALSTKKRGRPPILGKSLDKYLQDTIVSMTSRGTAIGSSVVVGIGRGILLKHDRASLDEFGGPIKLNKEWARSVLRRMGFSKRRANSKSKLTPSNFTEIKELYLTDIYSVVKFEEIPDELVLNWDQTAMKVVPSSAWTMEKRGTKRVEISALDDKRQITAVFACSMSGKFLPIQLIYKGTTKKCFPKNVSFPNDWHITCTENHWSNESTMIEYVKLIIVPYVTEKRKQLKLHSKYPALVLFDFFKGQCTDSVFKLLDENNILHIMVPANCTDRLQPLDLSVNKPAKDFMKSKFQEWYGKIICQQLEDGINESVDMRLSVMKPLMAKWAIDMYEYFLSQPNIIINGYRAAGIIDVLKD